MGYAGYAGNAFVLDGNTSYPDSQTEGALGIQRENVDYLKGGSNQKLSWGHILLDASGYSNRYGGYTEVNPLYESCKFCIRY